MYSLHLPMSPLTLSDAFRTGDWALRTCLLHARSPSANVHICRRPSVTTDQCQQSRINRGLRRLPQAASFDDASVCRPTSSGYAAVFVGNNSRAPVRLSQLARLAVFQVSSSPSCAGSAVEAEKSFSPASDGMALLAGLPRGVERER